MLRKELYFCLIFIYLPFSVIIAGEDSFAGGSGILNDPYLVETAQQLNNIRNHLNAHFRQIADIDLSEYAEGTGWEPIGSWRELNHYTNEPFQGVYDGNGYVIKNLTIRRPGQRAVGLFGNLGDNAKILRVGLENSHVVGNWAVGTLAGFMEAGSDIMMSYAKGQVEGEKFIGGLVGYINHKDSRVSSIQNSYTEVDIMAGGRVAGGLAGRNRGGNIFNTYAAGKIQGDNSGGIVGVCVGTIRNSYFDRDTTGQDDDRGKGTALSTGAMKQQDSFSEWDFTNTWIIEEEVHYPQLRPFM